MPKKMVRILCLVFLLPIFVGCSENIKNNATEPQKLQYPDAFYWERENCRFDLNEIYGHKTPAMDALLCKGKPVKTPQEGRQLAEVILRDLQSLETYQEYILSYVEYATKDRVWLFCYETKTSNVVFGSTMCYVLINSADGSIIAVLPSGYYEQQESTEQLPVQYAETRYCEVEKCDYELNAVEPKKDPRLEAFLSKGEPVTSSWKGKLLAEELLVKELRAWSDEYQNYVPILIEYATEEKVWTFLYSRIGWDLAEGRGSSDIYIIVDGTDGSLITYWYEGTIDYIDPPEGLKWELGDESTIPPRKIGKRRGTVCVNPSKKLR